MGKYTIHWIYPPSSNSHFNEGFAWDSLGKNVILVTVTGWGLYSTGRFNRQSMAKICSPLVFVGCEVL